MGGAELAGDGESLPCPFLEIEEKYPDFVKTVP